METIAHNKSCHEWAVICIFNSSDPVSTLPELLNAPKHLISTSISLVEKRHLYNFTRGFIRNNKILHEKQARETLEYKSKSFTHIPNLHTSSEMSAYPDYS